MDRLPRAPIRLVASFPHRYRDRSARGGGRQSKKSKVGRVEYHAALPYTEIGIFIGELRQQEGIASRALEFAILAAARTGEMIGAKWDEINFAERLWIVADNRMKAGKEHRVPLTDAALAILEEMQNFRSGDFVFPGGKVAGHSATWRSYAAAGMGRADCRRMVFGRAS
jgi:integrase